MVNNHNLCMFEGRMTKNITFSQIQGSNGPIDKAFFSVMVPRNLTSQERQAIKNGNTNVKGNDFVQFSLIGGQVNVLKQYFPEGTPIALLARYKEYETTDASTGQKKYGHCFEVDNLSFVVSPSQTAQGNNNNNNNAAPQQTFNQNSMNPPVGYQQQPVQQNYQQQQAPAQGAPQQNQQQGNFQLFNSEQFPF